MSEGTSEMTVAIVSGCVVATVGVVAQVLIGYAFKRGVEAKDEKIVALKTRVDALENERVATIESDIAEGTKSRKRIYDRIEKCEQFDARVEVELRHVQSLIPEMSRISNALAATTATLQSISEEVKTLGTRIFSNAKDVGVIAGKIGGKQ